MAKRGYLLPDLVVFGAWYFFQVVAEIAERAGWRVLGCVDPDPPPDVEVLTSIPADAAAIVAIGDNGVRGFVHENLVKRGRALATIIHESAQISRSARIGNGCLIAEGAVVRANAVVGESVVLNSGAVVSHDCHIDDLVTFGPNAAVGGHVKVGRGTTLGVGAAVGPWLEIGRDCSIGPGAAVLKNIGDGLAVIGNPGRTVRAVGSGPGHSDWSANTLW